MRRLAVIVTLLVTVSALAGCQTARVGARCTASQGAARNDTHVLFCVKGRWKAALTIGQAADILLAGVPTRAEVFGPFLGPITVTAGSPMRRAGVTVLNNKGVGVAGRTVTFSGPATGPGLAVPTMTVVTDVVGQASIEGAALRTRAGDFEVRATVDGLGSPALRIPVRVVPGVGRTVAVANTNQQVVAGNALAPIVIDVVDPYGNPVPGAKAGLLLDDPLTAGPTNGLAITESNGRLTITTDPLTALGTVSGPIRVYDSKETQLLGEIRVSWTVVPGPADHVQTDPGYRHAPVNSRYPDAIVVAVMDAWEHAVLGVPVTLTVIPGAGGASGTLTTIPGDNGGYGAAAWVDANGVAGDWVVRVTFAGSSYQRDVALHNT